MKALIAGAGIGGLTTALHLHKLGIEVAIFESVYELKPLGAGINLLPHGAKVLHELGLEERLAETAIKTREIKHCTRYGQVIYSEPRGMYAGFNWPQYSIHRGELQFLLLEKVLETLGPNVLRSAHHLDTFEQDDKQVTAHFIDKLTGERAGSYKGDMLIAADGIHSAARKQFYPDEGPAIFGGVMMWRGVAETEEFLDGETMLVIGNIQQRAIIYPISADLHKAGRSLTNWVMELRTGGDQAPEIEDWNREADLSEFADRYTEWDFEIVNVPSILEATPTILRYPMVDRDPLPRWSFGRVTLLGDAAHPMYPMGANGASQAILDAVALAESLELFGEDVPAALAAYATLRQSPTAEIVHSNRGYGPEAFMQIVDERIKGPEDRVEDVITKEEIEAITSRYRKTAGFDQDELNKEAGGGD